MSPGLYFAKIWRKKLSLAVLAPIVLAALCPEILRHVSGWKRSSALAAAPPGSSLGVKELVQEVRAELAAIERDMLAKNERALFRLETFEMELNFVVRAGASEKLGGHTELVTAESEIETGSEKVQKLVLHWKATEPEKMVGADPEKVPLTNAVDNLPTPAPPKKTNNP
jgi:hypothetical protein